MPRDDQCLPKLGVLNTGVGEPLIGRHIRRDADASFRCSGLGRSAARSGPLVGVVAEDEPPAALATRIHHLALGRRRELLEHLAVEALVLRRNPGSRSRLSSSSRTRLSRSGSTASRVARERRPWASFPSSTERSALHRPHFAKCICVSLAISLPAWSRRGRRSPFVSRRDPAHRGRRCSSDGSCSSAPKAQSGPRRSQRRAACRPLDVGAV